MKGYTKSVCVYCGSSTGTSDVYAKSALALGSLFHAKKWRVINGGGAGLMELVSQTTFGENKDGYVTGVIPKALLGPDHAFFNSKTGESSSFSSSSVDTEGNVTMKDTYGESVIVPDMHTRKMLMAKESDAFVALPGGFGTLEEILECITWSQLNIHAKPIVLFNIAGFYDEIINFIDKSIAAGFMHAKNRDIFKVAETAEQVVEHILNYEVPEGRFKFTWEEKETGESNETKI